MIGIYGGTFNPIHLGHLRAAEEVVAALSLSRMLFVPSARPPHKDLRDQVIAPARERLAWLEAALADHPVFTADPIELERPGASYLVDTLTTLSRKHSDKELVFVLGRDAFCDMGNWREPEKLFAMTHIAVTTRPPDTGGDLSNWLPECVRSDFALAPDGRSARHLESKTWIRLLEISALDISATEIRARLSADASIRDLVPAAAREAIVASGCYTRGLAGDNSQAHSTRED